jgi:lipoyl(octanoyl) transferase
MKPPCRVRLLGLQPYEQTCAAMREYTLTRDADATDEIWLLQHPPVFTQGQAGRTEHVLAPGVIPVVRSDRGGQVTYHGPGQLVGYVLLDLARLGYGIRGLVTRLEQALVGCLHAYGIAAHARRDAPGVYVADGRKIASLGLRVRHGCTYHGLALNVAMDLEPFTRINPCGYAGLAMTQISEQGGPADIAQVIADLQPHLLHNLGLQAAAPDHAGATNWLATT